MSHQADSAAFVKTRALSQPARAPCGFISNGGDRQAKLRNQHRGKGTQVGTRSFLTGDKKCCSTQGAARLFSGRPRQPAATPNYKLMQAQTIRTSSYVHDVQWGVESLDIEKPQDSSTGLPPLSGCPMQIRYRRVDEIKNGEDIEASITKRFDVPIGQLDMGVLTPLPSGDNSMSNGSPRHWTTRTYTSGVIV